MARQRIYLDVEYEHPGAVALGRELVGVAQGKGWTVLAAAVTSDAEQTVLLAEE